MKEILDSIAVERPRSVVSQLTERMRELILSGQLPAGSSLPKTLDLCAQWAVPVGTVQQVMTALSRQGLVSRTPRRGTFVRRRAEKLVHAGIYFSDDVLSAPSFGFFPALHARLRERLAKDGMTADVFVDTRPTAEQDSPFPSLLTACEQRRVQAVISPNTDWPHLNWIVKLPVPVTAFTTGNLPGLVSADYAAFFRLAVKALVEQGCRSLAVIDSTDLDIRTHPDGSPHETAVAYDALLDAVNRAGLRLRDCWIQEVGRDGDPTASAARQVAHLQRFGYEAARRILSPAERPDGLIVANDVLAVGVLHALSELGIRAPRDLRLVLHKNSDVDIFCTQPVTTIEFSTHAIADALVDQVQRQWAGESPAKVWIAPEVRGWEPENEAGMGTGK